MAIFVSLDLEYILNWTLQFINVIFLFTSNYILGLSFGSLIEPYASQIHFDN